MTFEDGRFIGATKAEILTVLVENAKKQERFGDDLNDNQLAVIRAFYDPVAGLLADMQEELSAIVDAGQLDYATGLSLDLLVTLIGVRRKPASKSDGTAKFSRDTADTVDHTIPRGTVVQTNANDPVRFRTTEKRILSAGDTSVTAPIQATEAGAGGNVGANTLTVMTSPPTGIEAVTNPSQTTGGENEEADDDLRARAQDELSDGMRGTVIGVINELKKTEGVKSVSPFINDESSVDGDGLDPHHVEYVVEGGTDTDVGQTLLESKAAGDGTEGGNHGTAVTIQADLPTGQTHPVAFSRPTEVLIYIDLDLDTTDTYAGDDEVRDAIVRYLGGIITSGDQDDGELRVGDDVIYTKVLSAVMSVEGVADAPSVTVGKSSSPTGTSNVAISDTEVANGDATNGSITITEV